MEHFPHLSRIHLMTFLFVVVLFTNCKKDSITTNPSQLSKEIIPQSLDGNTAASASTASQTRTATLFNYNLAGNLVTNYSSNSKATDVASDDGVYAFTKKLATRDGYTLLVLEGFGFNIPGNATIKNIFVKARRFKTGALGIRETTAGLVMKRESQDLPEWWERYGARWADPNYFPAIESEVNYSQSGSGANVSDGVSYPYNWTPARINDPYFGVLFQTAAVERSKGSAIIYYDYVEITVEYSLP